jgi:hypothetical protein
MQRVTTGYRNRLEEFIAYAKVVCITRGRDSVTGESRYTEYHLGD